MRTRPELTTAFVGIAVCLGLFLFALVSAYADARPLWYAYPFFVLAFAGLRASSSAEQVPAPGGPPRPAE
jgi:hypothetical protein